MIDETELFINSSTNQNLTQTDIDNIDVKSPLEHQIQQKKMKDSGWSFDKIISMTTYFHQTGILNVSKHNKIPWRSNALLNFENNDKQCFIWSILTSLHPCNNNHPNRVSIYRQSFNELNIQGFDFLNGFKCCDVHKFNELNNLSVNIFELILYQDQSLWKHKLPIEVSKNHSDRIIDLLIYKNRYVLIEKIHIFLGDDKKNFYAENV